MLHLYASTVRIERPSITQVDGVPEMSWSTVSGGESVRCRLDLNFMRPGKDIAPAPVAGKAPDRIGIMFCSSDTPIRAGDRIVAIPGYDGTTPVSGTFEVRVVPDQVVGFSFAHHIEVQVIETNQELDDQWPGDDL
jgi:hypothetical protein